MVNGWRYRAVWIALLVLSVSRYVWGGPTHPPSDTSAAPVSCSTSVFFAPGDGPEQALAIELRHLQKRQQLRVAMYGINSATLVKEILAANDRDVDMAWKVDATQTKGAKQKAVVAKLKRAGIKVQIAQTTGFMHDKFAVWAGRLVSTGSYNWTDHARTSNRENLVLLDCPALADKYLAEWELIPTE